jgi:ATP-binding cassette, subfamily B, multidrug efflux pump
MFTFADSITGRKISNIPMKSLSYLNKYLIKYKWLLIWGTVFVALSNLFYVFMPIIAKESLDKIIALVKEDYVERNLWLLGFQIAGLYMLFAAIKGVFLFFTRQTIIKASRFIEYDLKNEIYQKYQDLSYSFYRKNQTGDLINRISEDVNHVRMYLGPGIMYGVNLLIMFLLVLPAMWYYSPELSLYALAPLPIMSYLIYKVSATMNAQSAEVQGKQSDISTFVQEAFSGINIIKTYLRERHKAIEFSGAAEKYKVANLKLALTNGLFMPTILFLIGLSNIVTIYAGINLIAAGEITEGVVLSFIFYINMLTWPMASLGWVTSLIQRAEASQARINNFLEEQEALFVDGQVALDAIDQIEFKNVHYKFSNSSAATLKDLNFTIPKGSKTGIVGRTGSGKSTIINLIFRHIDPSDGQVLVNGRPLPDFQIKTYRKMIGAVPQEVFLFSDSIGNNIRFGLPEDTPDQAVLDAAKFAHVHHNIEEFENQYDTVLGERGINLSGGQKQRISLARAVIKKPDLLIFDDSLSAVDTETEEIILNNIKTQLAGVTTIIIAHRLSSVVDCDQILVLENGKIAESGTHEELLNLGGIYAEMYEKQLVEE